MSIMEEQSLVPMKDLSECWNSITAVLVMESFSVWTQQESWFTTHLTALKIRQDKFRLEYKRWAMEVELEEQGRNRVQVFFERYLVKFDRFDQFAQKYFDSSERGILSVVWTGLVLIFGYKRLFPKDKIEFVCVCVDKSMGFVSPRIYF